MTTEYNVLEFSQFIKYYKKVRKKFKNSFDKDFDNVRKVITRAPEFYNGLFEKLPQTKKVAGLGDQVAFPVYKTRIYISQAKGHVGRLVYLFDEERSTILLIDVYYKSEQSNHSEDTIKTAYNEYVDAVKEEE